MAKRASERHEIPHEEVVAAKLNSAAIHLLRSISRQDTSSGLSPARLSALSVVVYGGPMTMGELAAAERVQLPTISRLATALEHDGLVVRRADPRDGRVVRIEATDKGVRTLEEARRLRIRELAGRLSGLSPEELTTLERSADLIEHVLYAPRRSGEPLGQSLYHE
jgi:DNA-binding MarR family transcriptional regulator